MKRTLEVKVSEVAGGFYHPREITIRLTPERAAVLQGVCVARSIEPSAKGYISVVESILDGLAEVLKARAILGKTPRRSWRDSSLDATMRDAGVSKEACEVAMKEMEAGA